MDTNPGVQKKKGFGCLEIAIVTFVFLVLAAIAIPDFLHFCGKGKQSEAKTNLGAIFTTQISYFAEHHTYAGGPNAFKLLNWEPEGQNMYAYACGDEYLPNKKGDMSYANVIPPWPAGVRPASSKTGFTCMAVGNIDNDTNLDIWSINDAKELVNQMNDI